MNEESRRSVRSLPRIGRVYRSPNSVEVAAWQISLAARSDAEHQQPFNQVRLGETGRIVSLGGRTAPIGRYSISADNTGHGDCAVVPRMIDVGEPLCVAEFVSNRIRIAGVCDQDTVGRCQPVCSDNRPVEIQFDASGAVRTRNNVSEDGPAARRAPWDIHPGLIGYNRQGREIEPAADLGVNLVRPGEKSMDVGWLPRRIAAGIADNERMDLDNGFGHDFRLADRGRTLVACDADRERHIAGCDALDDDLGSVRSGCKRDPSRWRRFPGDKGRGEVRRGNGNAEPGRLAEYDSAWIDRETANGIRCDGLVADVHGPDFHRHIRGGFVRDGTGIVVVAMEDFKFDFRWFCARQGVGIDGRQTGNHVRHGCHSGGVRDVQIGIDVLEPNEGSD